MCEALLQRAGGDKPLGHARLGFQRRSHGGHVAIGKWGDICRVKQRGGRRLGDGRRKLPDAVVVQQILATQRDLRLAFAVDGKRTPQEKAPQVEAYLQVETIARLGGERDFAAQRGGRWQCCARFAEEAVENAVIHVQVKAGEQRSAGRQVRIGGQRKQQPLCAGDFGGGKQRARGGGLGTLRGAKAAAAKMQLAVGALGQRGNVHTGGPLQRIERIRRRRAAA